MKKKNSTVNNRRVLSYKIILDFILTYKNLNDIFNNRIINARKASIPFIKEIVYGVVRNKKYLDYIIKNTSKTKLNKIDRKTYVILLIGSYQIIYMDSIPSYASIFSTVELSKIYTKKSYKFINGVLRNINRNHKSYLIDKTDLDSLSIKYSYPYWLIKKWSKIYSDKDINAICINNSIRPSIWIRINTLKIKIDDLVKLLNNANIDFSLSEDFEYFIKIDKLSNEIYEFLEKGYLYVQNPSSALVVKLFNFNENDKILDICAAPGGKLTLMNQLMNNQLYIDANDNNSTRLKILKDNVENLSVKNISFFNKDLFKFSTSNKYDCIILDAPCSSSGTIRKNPDVKWRISSQSISKFSYQQGKMLKYISKFLRTNGSIIYSTCSIEFEENYNIINTFLKENNNFRKESIEHLIPKEYINDNGDMLILPNLDGYEGMFASKLIKYK